MHWLESYEILVHDLWHLPEPEAKTLWFALQRARTVRPVLFLQHLCLLGTCRTTQAYRQRLCAPATIVAVVEALVHERALRRKQGTHIEEHILRQVTAQGAWLGDSPEGQDTGGACSPDVVLFAATGTT